MTKSSISDAADFNEIYLEFYPKVLRYLSRLTDRLDAEDIAQEVFEKVSRSLKNFKGESKLSTWLFRIATNTAIDKMRSSSYRRSSEKISIDDVQQIEDKNSWHGDKEALTDQTVIRQEMSACVNEYVDKLPPDYKAVILLSELEGFKNREIADILQVSLGTVKIRLHRARAMLKKELNGGCNFYHNEQNILACDRKTISIKPKP